MKLLIKIIDLRSKSIIVDKILSKKNMDGSFGKPLSTAFAVLTLMNFNSFDKSLSKAVEHIVNTQNSKGSWDKSVFFKGPEPLYYGSDELNTAICLEALQKYRQRGYVI